MEEEDGGEETIQAHLLLTLNNHPPRERHTTSLILTTKDGLPDSGPDWRVVRQQGMDWAPAEVGVGAELKRENSHGIIRGPIRRTSSRRRRRLLSRADGLGEGIRSLIVDGLVGVRRITHRPIARVQIDAIGMTMRILGVHMLALDSAAHGDGSLGMKRFVSEMRISGTCIEFCIFSFRR